MYKLLIVDDEVLEREGLKKLVNWNALGIELVGCAANGQAALEMYLLQHPEMVITDIRMPFMDGLELTKRIRAIDPSVIVILLSAYTEFEYARTAIRTGVFDYILKPIEIGILEDTVRRAVKFKTDHRQKIQEGFPLLNDQDNKNFKADVYAVFLELEDGLLKVVKRADGSEAVRIFEALWSEFAAKDCSLDFIKRWGLELYALLTKALIEVGENADLLFCHDDPAQRLVDLNSKDQLYDYFIRLLTQVCCYIDTNKSFKNKKIIDAVLKMIHAGYGDQDLSLNKIAETIYITPNYLSTLFKLEVGQGFSDYLTAYRIEKAKKLLKDLSLKIYDIAGQVGYADPHYFSKIFKIVTGMTPKEFRNQIQ